MRPLLSLKYDVWSIFCHCFYSFLFILVVFLTFSWASKRCFDVTAPYRVWEWHAESKLQKWEPHWTQMWIMLYVLLLIQTVNPWICSCRSRRRSWFKLQTEVDSGGFSYCYSPAVTFLCCKVEVSCGGYLSPGFVCLLEVNGGRLRFELEVMHLG